VRARLAALALVAACSQREPRGTCAEARARLAELGGDGLDACETTGHSPRELACMRTAPDLERLWRCEWLDPGAKADLQRAHDGPLATVLSKMLEANQLRRESSARSDPEPLDRSLPLIDEAVAALRGFDPAGWKVEQVLDTMASALEKYRGAIDQAARALRAGDPALLADANATVDEAMTMVRHAEAELAEGMAETGLEK
jgi:hypothetical protein